MKFNYLKKKLDIEKVPFDMIICADTICEMNGKVIEKPKDKLEV